MDPIITRGVAESPFPNTYSSGVLDARNVIKAHVPSLTDLAAEVILTRLTDDDTDVADLAVRQCACGLMLDGYYEYVDHVVELLGGESFLGTRD